MQNYVETNKLKQLILRKKTNEFKQELIRNKDLLNEENIYEIFITALNSRKCMDILFNEGYTPYYEPKDKEGRSLLRETMGQKKWNMLLYLLKDRKIKPSNESPRSAHYLDMSCLTSFIINMDITKERDQHILSLLIKLSKCHNRAEKFEKNPPLHTLILSKFDRHASGLQKDQLIDKIRFLYKKGFEVSAKNREGLNVIELAQYKLDKLNMSSGNTDYFIDCLKEFTVEYEKSILRECVKEILLPGNIKQRI